MPVVRDADRMSLAEIEKTIADFGRRARDGTLKIEELQGGTFTITNGGVYGSLMSTPILNAPQSGILGMHKIQERPVVVAGKIEARPMMYLALSYDHRIVDGQRGGDLPGAGEGGAWRTRRGWCWICEGMPRVASIDGTRSRLTGSTSLGVTVARTGDIVLWSRRDHQGVSDAYRKVTTCATAKDRCYGAGRAAVRNDSPA